MSCMTVPTQSVSTNEKTYRWGRLAAPTANPRIHNAPSVHSLSQLRFHCAAEHERNAKCHRKQRPPCMQYVSCGWQRLTCYSHRPWMKLRGDGRRRGTRPSGPDGQGQFRRNTSEWKAKWCEQIDWKESMCVLSAAKRHVLADALAPAGRQSSMESRPTPSLCAGAGCSS
eukprot:366490-Chlamydomonas_euryale.AAC.6